MKLIYERTYQIVSSSMTDAQIGARKNKSVRNHLFILNSIISDVNSSKNKAKAISAELLELSLKIKLEETGKTR